ncbi:MAG: hypothetical protein K8U57_01155 [Planctomycetes bacterium]|nr:hypothetical protein [Planctomycetota bacterium]
MLLSRWKMMAGVLGVTLGGLAAVAGQCPKMDSSKTSRHQANLPPDIELPKPSNTPPAGNPSTKPAIPPAPVVPTPGLPSLPTVELPPAPPATQLPDLPKATEKAPSPPTTPPMATPTPPATLPAVPASPVIPASGTDVKPLLPPPVPSEPMAKPTPPVATPTPPSSYTEVPPPVTETKPTPPKPSVPSFTPPANPAIDPPPSDPVVEPSPRKSPKPEVYDAPKANLATKYRILLRVGEGEPTFEVKFGDDLVLKVICEKIDIKSPEKGAAGLSAVKASGKVRFVGFGAEGTCEELSFLAGTGEVSMAGAVKIQVKDKLGRIESELSTETMKYKIDPSAVLTGGKP